MRWIRKLRELLRPRILRRQEDERDLEDELRFDLQEEAHLRMERGESPESARTSSRRDFGNHMLVKEATRDMWGWTWLERGIQDCTFAWRTLKKSPAFTLVAIASLAIGIGANAAIFSLVDAILLQSLPVRDPDQLRLVLWTGRPPIPRNNGSGYTTMLHGIEVNSSFSYPMYKLLAASVPEFSHLMGFAHATQTVIAGGESHYAEAYFVTGNFFDGLGVNPFLGRMLSPDDDRASATPAAVISYLYWERRFGLDAGVIGRNINVNGRSVVIAGVTPRSFGGLEAGRPCELFLPMTHIETFGPKWYSLAKDDHWWVQMLGRLKTGVSETQARAALEVVLARAGAGYEEKPEHKRSPFRPVLEAGAGGVPLVREQATMPLLILGSVVGLVLLIACANIANLMLARGTARRREIAIRLSIGAGRGRLIRQLLTESFVLAGVGSAVGLIFASPLAKAILAMAAGDEALNFETPMNARVLLFTAGVAILTTLLFGLAPALRATRVDLTPALKDGSAGAGGAGRQLGLTRLLVMGQVALSTLLLVSATLFVRTLVNLATMDPGFKPARLLIFSVDGSRSGYQGAKLVDLYERIREKIGAIPGVQAVTLSDVALIGNSMSNSDITVPGHTSKAGKPDTAYHMAVGSGFLTTMGIPLVLGRDLNDRERPNGAYVGVINEKFARDYFDGRNPIGRIFYFGQPGPKTAAETVEVVGVSKDAKYDNLKHMIPPTVYLAYQQHPDGLRQVTFEIRTALAMASLAAPIRRAVAGIDRNVPVADMRTQEEQIRLTLSLERAFAALVGSFGLIAALLAAIGLYGVMAFAVTRRTAEIGIRMALGAERRDVQRMVLRDSLFMVVMGIAVGVPAALALTRLVRDALYGVAPDDPLSFIAAGMLMLAVAALAGWIPARRASQVDPMHALRHE